MAEINVKIKGDDAEFKRKLAEDAEQAKLFGEKIKEQFVQAKDVAVDFAGENGLGKVSKMFAGGLGVAAAGTLMADFFKDAISESAAFEKNVAGLKNVLGPATAGMASDLEKWVESVSGAMGTVEEDHAALALLLGAKIMPEEAKRDLIDIQNIAKTTSASIEETTRMFLELKGGEIPRGFFRENLQIAAVARSMMPAAPTQIWGKTPAVPATPEQEEQSLQERVQKMGGAKWLLQNVLPQIAPGGINAPVRVREAATATGQWADLGAQFTALKTEVGNELLPAFKDLAQYLKDSLPTIKEDLVALASGLESVLKTIGAVGKTTGDILGPILHPPTIEEIRAQREKPADINWLQPVWNEMVREFQEATRAHNENAQMMGRALRPE